jgi:hypothetical protein
MQSTAKCGAWREDRERRERQRETERDREREGRENSCAPKVNHIQRYVQSRFLTYMQKLVVIKAK